MISRSFKTIIFTTMILCAAVPAFSKPYSMDEYITTAQEQASDEGKVYEGMLDSEGNIVQE